MSVPRARLGATPSRGGTGEKSEKPRSSHGRRKPPESVRCERLVSGERRRQSRDQSRRDLRSRYPPAACADASNLHVHHRSLPKLLHISLGRLVQLVSGELLSERLLHFLVFLDHRSPNLIDLDHVPSELGSDRIGDLAFFEPKRDALELGQHHSALEVAEIATLGSLTAFALSLREGRKIDTALARFLGDRQRLLPGLLRLLGSGIRGHPYHDASRVDLGIVLLESYVLLILRFEILLGDLHPASHLLLNQLEPRYLRAHHFPVFQHGHTFAANCILQFLLIEIVRLLHFLDRGVHVLIAHIEIEV